MKNRKIILGISSAIAVSMPLLAVVACSQQTHKKKENGFKEILDNATIINIIGNPTAAQTIMINTARSVLASYIPSKQANDIRIGIVAKDTNTGDDVYEYSVKNGILNITGSSVVAIDHGVYEWIKSHGYGMVDWGGSNIEIPAKLTDEALTSVVSPYKKHYFINPVSFGYTTPYWDFTQWKKQLNWMAMHGYDMTFALVATEAISYKVFKKIGISDSNLMNFYNGPAFAPWQRMGNIMGWDKNPYIVDFNAKQVQLQHQILDYMKLLGITPIVPAFAGFVPPSILQTPMFQGVPSSVLNDAGWGGWPAQYTGHILNPTSTQFQTIGVLMIKAYEKEFGKMDYYAADTFNEMNIPASVNKHTYISMLIHTCRNIHFIKSICSIIIHFTKFFFICFDH